MRKQWQALYFGAPKVTTDCNCSHEIKRCLLLGRKTMTNLGSILKSRDITLLTQIHIVKSMAFPEVMYGFRRWKRRLNTEELMLSNNGAEEDS